MLFQALFAQIVEPLLDIDLYIQIIVSIQSFSGLHFVEESVHAKARLRQDFGLESYFVF